MNTKFFRTLEEALQALLEYGDKYMLCENRNGFPQYSIIMKPETGDAISRSLNGDSYPDGHIKSISKSYRLIISTSGKKYYRYHKTGTWLLHGMWTLIPGHISEINPHL